MSMPSDPNYQQFTDDGIAQKPPTEQGNWLFYCLGGCLLMLLLAAIGLGILSYVIYMNSKAIAVNLSRAVMVQTVENSELSEPDKREIVRQIDRVSEDFKAGKITTEQLGQIGQELTESPLFVVGMVYVLQEKYVKPSGLSESEKQEARLTLQRAARGAYEGKISESELQQATDPLMKPGPNGESELKESVTDEELRTFLADLKQLADAAEIPEEEFQVSIGQEFRKAVDRVYEQ